MSQAICACWLNFVFDLIIAIFQKIISQSLEKIKSWNCESLEVRKYKIIFDVTVIPNIEINQIFALSDLLAGKDIRLIFT